MKKLHRFYTLTALVALFSACSGKEDGGGTFGGQIVLSNLYPAIGEPVIASVNKDGNTLKSVEWSWGDGSVSLLKSPKYAYPQAGNYTVKLKATDGSGQNIDLSVQVKVEGRGLTATLAGFDKSKIWIMAHRGNSSVRTIPENSLAAINKCIDLGYVDMVEIDVRRTKDGTLILMHDASVDRTTTGSGNVADMNWTDIQKYFLKDRDGVTTTQKVPTLKEALLEARGRIWISLDFPNGGMTATEIYRVINECGMNDRVFFYTASNSTLCNDLLAQSSAIHIYPFYSGGSGSVDQLNTLKDYGRTFFTQVNLSVSLGDVNAGYPATIVGQGFLVSTNLMYMAADPYSYETDMVAGNYTGVDRLLARGNLHMIQTDAPEALNTYLTLRGKR